jgi:hypothetical protein
MGYARLSTERNGDFSATTLLRYNSAQTLGEENHAEKERWLNRREQYF